MVELYRIIHSLVSGQGLTFPATRCKDQHMWLVVNVYGTGKKRWHFGQHTVIGLNSLTRDMQHVCVGARGDWVSTWRALPWVSKQMNVQLACDNSELRTSEMIARILTGCIIRSCLLLLKLFRCVGVHVCVCVGRGSLHFCLVFKVILFV